MNNVLTKNKRMLTTLNSLVIVGLIILDYIGFFNSEEWFGFLLLSAGVLVLAVYRPVIVFALLIGVIPLEIINIAPYQFGVELRPYQFLVFILVLAVIIRQVFRLSKQKIFKWSIFDTLITIFVSLGFVNLIFNDNVSVLLKQLLVVVSFGLLYFVVRYFVNTKDDVLALFPILISSAVTVAFYGILQNIAFFTGKELVEMMPGRPNATFVEPDWLGMYLVFSMGVLFAYLYYSTYHKHLWKFFNGALYISGVIIFVTLILTVARSAWLGAIGVILGYLLIIFLQKKYKLFAMHSFWIFSLGILSIIIVWGFHLTNFELFNRVQSTHSGLQEITIACDPRQLQDAIPTEIGDVSELGQYGCEHINLEDIVNLKSQGYVIAKIYRKDPNVEIRTDVYTQTITLITQKPIIGYGWGSSSQMLGTDENGTPLNTSNIFLETIFSIGVLGGIVLGGIFVLAVVFSIKLLFKAKNLKQKSIAIFILITTIAIVVPNLFNAGLFLGFIWMFFGLLDVVRKI
jgi:hypothetical protein